MSSADLLKFNEQVIETWNTHDANRFESMLDDNITWNINNNQERYKGKNEVKSYFENWKRAFPDLKLRVLDTVADKDRISVEYEFTGTHKGPLTTKKDRPEIPATNKRVTSYGSYTAKLKNNRLTELNNYPDRLGLMDQLGVLSAMEVESV